MRSGSKRSFCRRLVPIAFAIVLVGLIAAPAALAQPSTVIAGLVSGKYYGGHRPITATVTVPDPSSTSAPPLNPSTISEAASGGFFITSVDFTSTPEYNATFAVTATADNFNTGASSFEYTGDAFVKTPVLLTLSVQSTRVAGKVKNAVTGKVLRGVKITVVGGKAALTSTKGKYSVTRALWPATKYKIKFSKTGFRSVTKKFLSNPGGLPKTVNVLLVPK